MVAGTGTPTGGATEPRESWPPAPVVKSVSYYEVMGTYYQPDYYRWDQEARAAYNGLV